METKTKKRLKKILIFSGIVVASAVTGYVVYKKVPAVREVVNKAAGKVGLVKKEEVKKYPESPTIRTPRPVRIDRHGVANKN